MYSAGAILLHIWTQSLQLAEIEHVLKEYADRLRDSGREVRCDKLT